MRDPKRFKRLGYAGLRAHGSTERQANPPLGRRAALPRARLAEERVSAARTPRPLGAPRREAGRSPD